MVAPYPVEAVAKGQPLSQRANQIYGHYCWLARWSDEIGADPDLDLKKLAQLAFIHCRLFDSLLAGATVELVRALEKRFATEGMTWASPAAMNADMQALRVEGAALMAYVRDNVPEARQASRVVYDPASDTGAEQVVKLPKPHPAVAEVAKLRALFAA